MFCFPPDLTGVILDLCFVCTVGVLSQLIQSLSYTHNADKHCQSLVLIINLYSILLLM